MAFQNGLVRFDRDAPSVGNRRVKAVADVNPGAGAVGASYGVTVDFLEIRIATAPITTRFVVVARWRDRNSCRVPTVVRQGAMHRLPRC